MTHQGVARGSKAPVSPPAAPDPALRLVEPLGARTWQGLAYDGTPVAARWLAATTQSASSPAIEMSLPAPWQSPGGGPATLRLPPPTSVLLPVLGLARTADAVWLLSELDDGVPLRRLLAAARLTPLQAAVVLDDVHAALVALHAEQCWHGRLHAGNVHVGSAGQVRLGDWGPALLVRPAVLDGHRDVDLAGLGQLAAELADAAGRPARPPGTRQAELLDALRRAGARRPQELAALVPDPVERASATAELSTLVRALRRVSRPLEPPPSAGQPLDPPASTPPRDPPVPTQRRSTDSPTRTASRPASDPPAVAPPPLVSPPPAELHPPERRRPPRLLLAGVTLAVLAAAVFGEVALLGSDIRASWKRLTTTTADEGKDPRQIVAGAAVPTIAPPAAGPITRVTLRSLETCVPGRVCPVRVLVQVWPDNGRQQRVHWSLVVLDRCTGARTTTPAKVAAIPPGADRVDVLGHVLLPKSRSLAVVAVTDKPSRTASPPLMVPTRAGPC